MGKTSAKHHTVAYRELGLLRRERPLQCGTRRLIAIEIYEHEATGLLRLGRSDQAPYRSGGEIDLLASTRRQRALSKKHQPRTGEALVGKPGVGERQGLVGCRMRRDGQLLPTLGQSHEHDPRSGYSLIDSFAERCQP